MTTRRASLALAVAIALVLAACGSSAAEVETGTRPDLAPAAASAQSPLPAVTVWDVGAEDWTQLADRLPAEKPLLVWFWAPHCPACAQEAPGMVAFAKANATTVDVVGLGTQDDAGMAKEFRDRHDVPFTMLWDESFESWSALGVSSQPGAVLFAANGDVLGAWRGPLPESEVQGLLV